MNLLLPPTARPPTPLYVYIENGMVPVPASQRHDRDTLPNPGGKWRWDNDEGWMSQDYRFVDADLLFFDKTLEFITQQHRKNFPDQTRSSWCSPPRFLTRLYCPHQSSTASRMPVREAILCMNSTY